MTFHLNIVSLKGQIFSGDVESVSLPAEIGRMTVYQNHMPVVSPLTLGQVNVKGETVDQYIIRKGIFTFSENNGELLVEDVIHVNEIDTDIVRERIIQAEEDLKKDLDDNEKNETIYQLKRSIIELKAAEKNNKKPQDS